MGLLSDVTKGMKGALSKADNKLKKEEQEQPEKIDVMELLNSGAEAFQNRQEQPEDNKAGNSKGKAGKSRKKASGKPDSMPKNPPILTHEEFCEEEIKKAHEKGLEDPDFDYRNYYEKGQQIYYVQIFNAFIKQKRIIPAKIRTVYPRSIVALEPKSQCVCIGYKERDQIFLTDKEAKKYYKTIRLPEDDSKPEKKSGQENKDVEEGEESDE